MNEGIHTRHRNAVALGGSVGRALLEAGAVVQDILVLFDYGTFPTQAARSRRSTAFDHGALVQDQLKVPGERAFDGGSA
ncbi:hypothetical protein [Cupriavidus sp. amp6]|uniref:hypothetical protein n=1 Tax=Cupriavidus sp. amp6 TaxID=388051 RepID=UPI000412EE57|nr:hypothetical protein [Cupriavidus sp. amp6]